jgi:hypothetical protein
MRPQRKMQIAAAIVIANAVAALQLTTPSVAMAAACAPTSVFICDDYDACSTTDAAVVCASYAPPGCTVTSGFCTDFYCNAVSGTKYILCNWQ